jgi:hypothetical protein
MKRRFGWLVMVAAALSISGCANPGWSSNSPEGTTSIAMAGRPGTSVDGWYVQYGRRTPFSATLPAAITRSGLSAFAVYKQSPEDVLALAAQTDDNGWHSEGFSQAGSDVSGLEVRVDKGLTVDRLVR